MAEVVVKPRRLADLDSVPPEYRDSVRRRARRIRGRIDPKGVHDSLYNFEESHRLWDVAKMVGGEMGYEATGEARSRYFYGDRKRYWTLVDLYGKGLVDYSRTHVMLRRFLGRLGGLTGAQIASGNGFYVRFLQDLGVNAIALDISPVACAIAKAIGVRPENVVEFDAKLGEPDEEKPARRLPFEDGSLDFFVSHQFLYAFYTPLEANKAGSYSWMHDVSRLVLMDLHRCLRVGGVGVIDKAYVNTDFRNDERALEDIRNTGFVELARMEWEEYVGEQKQGMRTLVLQKTEPVPEKERLVEHPLALSVLNMRTALNQVKRLAPLYVAPDGRIINGVDYRFETGYGKERELREVNAECVKVTWDYRTGGCVWLSEPENEGLGWPERIRRMTRAAARLIEIGVKPGLECNAVVSDSVGKPDPKQYIIDREGEDVSWYKTYTLADVARWRVKDRLE